MAAPFRNSWIRMRAALWPDAPAAELGDEVDAFLARGAGRQLDAVFVATEGAEAEPALGFVELSTRPYAEGCSGERVAYVEGWYVRPDWRGRGVGRALIDAAARWARARGLHELASDTELDNGPSQAAHEALGFVETNRVVTFRKPL